MINVGDILNDNTTDEQFRVLWLSKADGIVFVINLHKNELPLRMALHDVATRFEDGFMETSQDDPFARLLLESEISENMRNSRDRMWEKLEGILSQENEPDIFDPKIRGPLVQKLSEEVGISYVTIYKQLKRYWQRGKNKNALLPDTTNSGGKGIKKKSTKKLGRPRKHGGEAGKYIDEKTERVFESAVRKYYHNRKEHTFKSAYQAMVAENFTQETSDAVGRNKKVLLPSEHIPTLDQFRYWYKKTYSAHETLKIRKGEGTYNLKHRAITGKSDTRLMGPGAKYQIDATVGDIYLVSQFNRGNIIGRPIIYFVVDAFSRMVTGVYIGLEGPSWMGAMMALANAASNKVKFCADYGIDINESEWPCHHIPDAILGDRGEMEGKSVETLINSLGVRIENTPPYRADMKGIVEQYFHTVDETVTAFLPGHIKPSMKERGGKDYRLDAKLDIRQFTKIVIECILYHNNEHLLENFERTESMIRDNVQATPIKLWEWGIKNHSGLLRSFPEDIVKLCLLPAAKASVTARGIRFKGIYYLCDLANREGWFAKARSKGSFRVDISYDPRNMTHIYLRNVGDSPYEICYLADWQEKYNNKCLDEIIYLHELEKLAKQDFSSKKLEARVNLSARVEEVVAEAVGQAKQTPLPKSKTKRTANIRANRDLEKKSIRTEEAFLLAIGGVVSADAVNTPIDVPDLQDKTDFEHNETTLPYLDLIRKNAQERKYD